MSSLTRPSGRQTSQKLYNLLDVPSFVVKRQVA